MPFLEVGKPVTTRTPEFKFEGRLSPGKHRFQLRVRSHEGLISDPATATVTVRLFRILGPVEPERPTPVFDPRRLRPIG